MRQFWPEGPQTHAEWKHFGKYIGIILILVIPVTVSEIGRRISKHRRKRPAP